MGLKEKHTEDVSILSKGVQIEGKFSSVGNVRIDGKIKGDVTVNGNLTLGESALIIGNVSAKNLTISGKIEGSVRASEKIILESKSIFIGDLFSKLLLIQEGAKFDGKSVMNGNASTESKKLDE